MPTPDPEALAAIRAWLRLQRGFEGLNRQLRRRHGLTGAQLAMLRIVAEREPISLAELRAELSMHPATIGQLIDRIVRLGLLLRRPSPKDARRRELVLTPRGRGVLRRAPLAGPVRLRVAGAPSDRLRRLAAAFDDAIELFGLKEWAA